MPHKRNPITAERITGLARVVRANAGVALENVPLWHERDISHSSAERVVIPDSFLALDYMLDRFAWMMEGLVTYPERMQANVDRERGLVASQQVLLALVEAGLARDAAYRHVQNAAALVYAGDHADLETALAADDEIVAALGRERLGDVAVPRPDAAGITEVFGRLPRSQAMV
jgi:adenylosuccinate lyase